MLVACGDTHQPMAVAEVLVGEPEFLRTEEQCDRSRRKLLAHGFRALLEDTEWMLQLALVNGRGAYHEAAVRNCFRHAAEELCIQQHF